MSLRYLIALIFLAACDKTSSPQEKESEKPVARAPEVRVVFEERASAGSGIGVRQGEKISGLDSSEPLDAGSVITTDAETRARLLVGETIVVLGYETRVQVFETDDELRVESGEVVVEGEGAEPLVVHTPHASFRAEHAKTNFIVTANETLVTVTRGEVGVTHGGQTALAFAGQEVTVRSDVAPSIVWSSQLGESVGWAELVNPKSEINYNAVPRGLGKLVGKEPGGERERELELVSHQVSARIAGNIAYTEVHESFRNPTGETLEGLYRFPLPPDAQISRLSLKVGNTWMEGEFLETARAERIWRDIIDQWRDPAILKWKQGNQFELRIFPIEPRQIREVKIGYTQELKPAAEGYRYVYPMAADVAGGHRAEKFGFEAKILGVDATAPLLAQGYPAEIKRGASEDDQATALVSYQKEEFRASGDLAIRFSRGAQKNETVTPGGTIRTWSYEGTKVKAGEPEGFVLSAIRPKFEGERTSVRRDFVVIADTSYSRRGLVSELQKELIQRLVEEMDKRDRVSAMACAVRCVPLAEPGFALASDTRALAISGAMGEVPSVGTYNALEGVEVATRLFASRAGEEAQREAHVIILTDGQVSSGFLNPSDIRARASVLLKTLNVRASVVNFGGDSDALVLRALASAGNGSVVDLDPALPRGAQALDVLQRHYGAVLNDVEVEAPAGFSLVTPPSQTTLMSGEELVFAARFAAPQSGEVTLRGVVAGQPWERRFPISTTGSLKSNSFVPRAWAAHRISQLELEDATEHRQDIINLSITYGVLSRYTALLALEDKAMMDEFGVQARKRDDWRGDEVDGAVEEESMEKMENEASGPSIDLLEGASQAAPESAPRRAPLPSPRLLEIERKSPKKEAKTSGQSKKDSSSLEDLEFEPPAIRQRSMRRPMPQPKTIYRIENISKSRTQARKDMARRLKALEREPENRTYMMRLIRTLIRAQEYALARSWADKWLERNSADPEALVQQAQLLSHQGNAVKAMEFLASAADSAARGDWIQERLMKAYRATGEEALACQQELALQTIKKRAFTASCELATDMTLFGLSRASLGGGVYAMPYRSGDLEIVAEWNGIQNYEILVVEPDGRTLSIFSQRRNLQVSRGDRVRKLSVPTMRTGAWQVRLVRTDVPQTLGLSRPAEKVVPVKVTIKAGNTKETLNIDMYSYEADVAEVTHSRGWR